MAYSTGTATEVVDLVDKIRAFALAQGWTIDEWSTPELHLSNSGYYFTLKGDTGAGTTNNPGPHLRGYGCTSYDSGSDWANQPGKSAEVHANKMPGSFAAYHLFAPNSGTKYVHCVIEISSGIYKHFGFGGLATFGSVTGGGAYMYSQAYHYEVPGYQNQPFSTYHSVPFDCLAVSGSSPTQVRADIDAKSPGWFTFDADQGGQVRGFGPVRAGEAGAFGLSNYQHMAYQLNLRTPNTFNELTPLIPMPVFVERASSLWSPVGYVQDMRYVNMESIVAGDTLTIGSESWMVFPLHQRTTVWNQGTEVPSSAYFGLAFNKIT